MTYTGGSVAVERAVVDLHIATIDPNSSALGVPYGPPGIRAKSSDTSFGRKCSDEAEK
jgi:hypothetical protein